MSSMCGYIREMCNQIRDSEKYTLWNGKTVREYNYTTLGRILTSTTILLRPIISLIYKLFPCVLVDYQRIFHKLEASTRSFVDLEPLKQQFLRFAKTAILNQKRKQLAFQVDDLSTQCLHFIFQGNPGTGQTTFARKVAGISSVHMCSIVLSYMFDMIFN